MTSLDRRLGTADATVIGLGSMLGAGVFVAFAPAARVAGTGLLVGLALAAVVAYCNATSSAQLAAQYPTSGGTYAYGRERLGEWWGFLAGWAFVIGKTASCAAMALAFAAYAAPGHTRLAAVSALVVLTAVNCLGITRTAALTRVLLCLVLLALGIAVVACLVGGDPSWRGGSTSATGVLQSAGLLFFAFAGYARIATLGEEVRDPARTVPRAVTGALAGAVVVYAVVGVTLLLALGPVDLGASTAPVADAVATSGWGWASPVVRVGAAAASLGALLALVAGIGRTALAMGRTGDLPTALATVHPRFLVPHRAQLAVGAAACLLVLLLDVRGAIGFSSFGVLLYYFVANAAAFTQEGTDRRYPRALQVVGALGCVGLALALPLSSVLGAVVVLAIGVAYRVTVRS